MVRDPGHETGERSSLGKAPARCRWQKQGRGFFRSGRKTGGALLPEPFFGHRKAARSDNRSVGGSNPSPATKKKQAPEGVCFFLLVEAVCPRTLIFVDVLYELVIVNYLL